MSAPAAGPARDLRAAGCVMAAGVVAALHVGKLPPALPVLREALGVSLLQSGFLLSLVQLAGMTLGLLTGLAVQRVGLRRSMLAGLLVLGLTSGLGALAQGPGALLLARALEGLGFLWVVLPAPGLLRRLVPQPRLPAMLGLWSAYMPLGTALALLLGPWVLHAGAPDAGWRAWWWGLSALALGFAGLVRWQVPADPLPCSPGRGPVPSAAGRHLLGLTLRSRPAWLLALAFAMYSGQWMAVIGFLPSIYAQAGMGAASAAWLSAGAAAVNIVGNIAAGRLLGRAPRPVRPLALLWGGFAAMSAGALLTFGAVDAVLVRYAGVLVFSMVGGMVPATLFGLAVRLAPSPDSVSTTVGWMQQWSSLGQFAGPPLVAWAAVRAGGWQLTGWVTSVCCLLGALLAWQIERQLRAAPATRPPR